MPVDTGIFNAFLQPPKSATDYANQFAQSQQLRNQNALTGLQLQQAASVNEQRNALRNAVQSGQIDLSDENSTGRALTMAPDVAPGLLKTIQDQRTSSALAKKDTAQAGNFDAESGATNFKTKVAKANQAITDISNLGTPDDAIASIKQHLQNGDIDMIKATSLINTLQPSLQDPSQFGQWKRQMVLGIMDAKDRIAATAPKVTMANAGGSLVPVNENADAGPVGQVAGAAPIKVTATPADLIAGGRLAEERRHNQVSEGVETVKADPYGTLGLNKTAPAGSAVASTLSGDDYLKTLPPAVANQVKMLSDGRLPITAQSARSPQMMQLLAMAAQYEPGTDATTYVQRAQTVKDFAPGGKDGQAITNLNTAIHHAGQLSDAIDNLNNSNILPGITNPVENYLGQKVAGQTTQGVYKQKADALASELRKVYAGGGGGSLSELNEWQKSFDQNASKDQQKAYLQSGMELLTGALQAKRDAYERGMGPRAQFGNFITPESTRVLTKLAPNFASQISASTGGGSPTPAAGVPDDIAAILAKHGSK